MPLKPLLQQFDDEAVGVDEFGHIADIEELEGVGDLCTTGAQIRHGSVEITQRDADLPEEIMLFGFVARRGRCVECQAALCGIETEGRFIHASKGLHAQQVSVKLSQAFAGRYAQAMPCDPLHGFFKAPDDP